MPDPAPESSLDRARRRAVARCFAGGVPRLEELRFADREVVLVSDALAVTVAAWGAREAVLPAFVARLREAAAATDPATDPADRVATALAVERAGDEEIAGWIVPGRVPSGTTWELRIARLREASG